MRRWLLSIVVLFAASPALAQQARPSEPLPAFVLDLRGTFMPLSTDPKTSDTLTITPDVLPGRGLGVFGGIHFYPLRRGSFGLGLGGEFLLAGGSDQLTDEMDVPSGPTAHRRIQSLSGQISLNFGHRRGWSYLTAGMGPYYYDTYLDENLPDGPKLMATNFGFGARWFNTSHVAFNVDLRFILSPPAEQAVFSGGRDRQKIMAISLGISLK